MDINQERLRSLKGLKWSKYGPEVIPAWVADMDFLPCSEVISAIQEMVDLGDFGYRYHDIDQLIPVWCDWIEDSHGWRPPADECQVFTSSMHALEAVMVSHSKPGDGVVLFSPIYMPFRTAIEEAGRRVVDVELQGPDWKFNPEMFKAALDSTTRVVLFCQPHNPTGHVYTQEELNVFAEIAVEYDLVVISDEIWADLVFDGNTHLPLSTSHEGLLERTVTIGSASKAFNLAGARCAAAHIGEESIRQKLSALPEHYFGQPSSFGAAATVAAWESGKPWLRNTLKQLHENRDFLTKSFAGTNIKMDSPQATYLAWLNFSNTNISEAPSKVILEKGRVALEPGSKFGPQSHSYARLNFATSPELLESIVERILEGVD